MVRTSDEALVDSFDDCLQLSVSKMLNEGKEWIRLWRLMKLKTMRELNNPVVDVDTDTEMEDAFVVSAPHVQRPMISLKRKRETLFGNAVPEKQTKTADALYVDRIFTRNNQ